MRDKERVGSEVSSCERLEMLKQYYLLHLVEDPMDGTNLDCDILDMIKLLKDKYKDK